MFLYKLSVSYNKSIEFLSRWKCLVINKLKIALKNNVFHVVSLNKDHIFKNTKSLQNNLIITHVKKTPNNFATISKSYYQESLSTDSNFKLSNDTIHVKNKRNHAFHKLLKLP